MKNTHSGSIFAIRPPSALIVDAGDEKAYLEWNPGLEESLVGYNIYRRQNGDFQCITPQPVAEPHFIDSGLSNGEGYRYWVTAVSVDGAESQPSNEVKVTPHAIKEPDIVEGETILRIHGHRPIFLEDALRVTFENGHAIVFDKLRMRVRDWVSDSGKHLLYPGVYGNALDLTEFNNWGYHSPEPASHSYPATPPPFTPDYQDFTTKHHYHRGMADWKGYIVQDGRVTFHYTLPLQHGIVDRHTRLKVWETWYAAEKSIAGTPYKGL